MPKIIFAGLFSLMAPAICMANHPCEVDFQTHCAKSDFSTGSRYQCFEKVRNKLSPQCANHLKKIEENSKFLGRACLKDIEDFCNPDHPGKGFILRCLKQNQSALSEACQAAVEKVRPMRGRTKKQDAAKGP